jgi:hypothetical protein
LDSSHWIGSVHGFEKGRTATYDSCICIRILRGLQDDWAIDLNEASSMAMWNLRNGKVFFTLKSKLNVIVAVQ